MADTPRDVKEDIILKLDTKSLIQLCKSDKNWNKTCKDKVLWENILMKKFGWRNSGPIDPYKRYILLNNVISDLIDQTPIAKRYLNRDLMEADIKPLVVKTLQHVQSMNFDVDVHSDDINEAVIDDNKNFDQIYGIVLGLDNPRDFKYPPKLPDDFNDIMIKFVAEFFGLNIFY